MKSSTMKMLSQRWKLRICQLCRRNYHSAETKVLPPSTSQLSPRQKPILEDNFERNHTYLRISLTERCNLRCNYCMPEDGLSLTSKAHLLSTSEILQLADLFVKQGVTKIRLTGGEPTVHKDLKVIIEKLKKMDRLKIVAMTTNGLTLVRQLPDLQKAGLDALNISLDTLNKDKFEKITRRKGWSRVMAGINLALELGYNPVKVNCVVMKGINDDEILDFVQLTENQNIHVRFIEYMPFGGNKWNSKTLVTYRELVEKIETRYPNFEELKTDFNETSKPYKVPGFTGQVGFISSISNNFCNSCNRLRLLADGSLKVCLLGSAEISLRDALRNNCSEDDILTLINAAVLKKKRQHADHLPPTLPLLAKLATFNVQSLRQCSILSHVTSSGDATMVDVGAKNLTNRYASAYAEVRVGNEIIKLIRENNIKKGDILSVAKLAGIMAAKKTSDLIPLCHNITLSFANVSLVTHHDTGCIQITSDVRCHAKTGVEMEALTAVTVAALTVYDMCKAALLCLLKCTIKLIFLVGIFISAILFLPNLPPHDANFTSYELPPTKKLEGPLALNSKLNNAEKLFENLLLGPESFVYHKGILYTGVLGGHVVKISDNSITPFVRFGKSCAGLHEQQICGRPLGLRMDSKDNLFVADTYYGIFKVNITTGEAVQLVDMETPIKGRKAKFVNSVAITSDGTIYWTESDNNFNLEEIIYSFLADGSGRLIKYDPVTKTNTVLMDRIHFANGIALSSDECQIYLAELSRNRILRYHLKGSNKGKWQVAVDGLPGSPDNIKSDKQGNMYVSLVLPRDDNLPNIALNIGKYPLLRKFLARILALTQDGIDIFDYFFPNWFLNRAFHSFRQLDTVLSLMPLPKRVTVVKLNKDGAVIDSLHATDGRISGISEIEFVDDYIYLGSPTNNYLARVKVGK